MPGKSTILFTAVVKPQTGQYAARWAAPEWTQPAPDCGIFRDLSTNSGSMNISTHLALFWEHVGGVIVAHVDDQATLANKWMNDHKSIIACCDNDQELHDVMAEKQEPFQHNFLANKAAKNTTHCIQNPSTSTAALSQNNMVAVATNSVLHPHRQQQKRPAPATHPKVEPVNQMDKVKIQIEAGLQERQVLTQATEKQLGAYAEKEMGQEKTLERRKTAGPKDHRKSRKEVRPSTTVHIVYSGADAHSLAVRLNSMQRVSTPTEYILEDAHSGNKTQFKSSHAGGVIPVDMQGSPKDCINILVNLPSKTGWLCLWLVNHKVYAASVEARNVGKLHGIPVEDDIERVFPFVEELFLANEPQRAQLTHIANSLTTLINLKVASQQEKKEQRQAEARQQRKAAERREKEEQKKKDQKRADKERGEREKKAEEATRRREAQINAQIELAWAAFTAVSAGGLAVGWVGGWVF
eukprot:TRINITY_DN3310_c0_g1_i1.p1 TRINITY_DN3310_c0_g1~~TRINITY_DN3310_c0_g1_i1.p1  ORF type:complete len:467 (-),score=49.12 TRINITY_DN3310_c0_g1_i1:544-1944(-)